MLKSSFKYMVALDGSNSSDEAFNVACSMLHKRRDSLFLITAIQTFPVGFGPFENYNTQLENIHRGYLEDYASRCEKLGITYRCILAKGSHVGGLICKAVEDKGIDFLVIGRRGMNRFSRLVAGSTSRYCMESANCNVIVVKGSYTLGECHDSLNKVKQMEEEERKRRMADWTGPTSGGRPDAALIKEAAQQERSGGFFGGVFGGGEGGKVDVTKLEEEERKRRIQEESRNREILEKRAREAALIKEAVREEREGHKGVADRY
jgi:nucleotide-binding universal stress UspA family protein